MIDQKDEEIKNQELCDLMGFNRCFLSTIFFYNYYYLFIISLKYLKDRSLKQDSCFYRIIIWRENLKKLLIILKSPNSLF